VLQDLHAQAPLVHAQVRSVVAVVAALAVVPVVLELVVRGRRGDGLGVMALGPYFWRRAAASGFVNPVIRSQLSFSLI
jgi:hypothetical protein